MPRFSTATFIIQVICMIGLGCASRQPRHTDTFPWFMTQSLSAGEILVDAHRRHRWASRHTPPAFDQVINAENQLWRWTEKCNGCVTVRGTVVAVGPIATLHIGESSVRDWLFSYFLAQTTFRVEPDSVPADTELPEHLAFVSTYANSNAPHRAHFIAVPPEWLPEARLEVCLEVVSGQRIRIVSARYACPFHRATACSCSVVSEFYWSRETDRARVSRVFAAIHAAREQQQALDREAIVVDDKYFISWVIPKGRFDEALSGRDLWGIFEIRCAHTGRLLWWTGPNSDWGRNAEHAADMLATGEEFPAWRGWPPE